MEYSDEVRKNLAAYYELIRKVNGQILKTATNDVPHSIIVTNAVYSPWYGDKEFLRLAQIILSKKHTLVDAVCLYELWDLVGQLKYLDGDILEVGTWRGGSGCLMAARALQDNIDCTVWLCDTFEGVVNTGGKDNIYRGGEHSDASEADVKKLAVELGIAKYEILTGIFPKQTGATLENKTFRICHVDVDTYEGTREIIEWCWPRLEVGGVIVSDDLGSQRCAGVARAFQEVKNEPGQLKLYNLNGHGVIIKAFE